MKKILLATTVLAATTGFAAAEVTLSGDARMGIISNFGDATTFSLDESDLAFTSRARVKFTLSGSTDGGLEFGASFRADNAAASNKATFTPGTPGTPATPSTPFIPANSGPDGIAGNADDQAATPATVGTPGTPGTPGSVTNSSSGGAVNGDAGSVFISGAFGKLSMGHVSGVGMTGLGDLNESTFIGNGDGATDPSALYEYSTGDLTIYASTTNPGPDAAATADAYSVAAKYALGDYTVALGYESVNNATSDDHIIAGFSATFGAATVKANYGMANVGAIEGNQYAVSVDYKFDAVTVTAYYNNKEDIGAQEAYGLGASYDLGGGASVVGGYVKNQTTDEDAYDLGVSMSF